MEEMVTLSVLSENHGGLIGDDWKYWIEVKVGSEATEDDDLLGTLFQKTLENSRVEIIEIVSLLG